MSGQIQTLLGSAAGVTVVAVVLFVARPYFTTLATWAAQATPHAVRRLYRRLRPVGGRRLKRYRDQVRVECANVRIGLSPADRDGDGGRPPGLRDVYVPLQCERGGGRCDAAGLLRGHRRTVLLGEPGAGKTLLLKHEMLEWADGGDDKVVPVIVELHASNRRKDPFEELITEKFQQAGIATAAEMVERRLDSGGLRVFFDGLDEVGSEEFERVVRELHDFAVRHPDCDMVVSCRTAAYDQQLQGVFDQEIRVAEFDDASILRFLAKWPHLADQVTAARIFQALQDDPELMVLARSPLMLTLIAYLQSGDRPESVGPLPNSRARFYDMAVAHLLDRDRLLNRSEAIGTYHAGRKTLVLQRLALRQLSESSARGDQQEITREQFESVVEELLPGFDLDRSPHLQGMLREIVGRSELIKDIDRGRHYQFTHLTLLEYLAACELRADEHTLMHHYRRDPKPWRETVRMWCAVTRGSCTRVVREVFEDADMWRKVLALQCLADAVHIEEELAEEILTFFLDGLGAPGDQHDHIAKGLGTLAASNSPRGRRVLAALVGTAQGPASARRTAALRALTVSGRQEAARALAGQQDDEARTALQAMGDVAVSSLARRAELGEMWAVRSLRAVGTPTAAVQLAGLLWSGHPVVFPVARAAAWNLAALMSSPDVRDALSEWTAPPDLPRDQQYGWIWSGLPYTGTLRVVAARVAWLMDCGRLDGHPASDLASDMEPAGGVTTVHPHIGIPLFACARFRWARLPSGDATWQEVDSGVNLAWETLELPSHVSARGPLLDRRRLCDFAFKSPAAPSGRGRQALEPLRDVLLRIHGVPPTQQAVLRALPWAVQVELVRIRFGDPAHRFDTRLRHSAQDLRTQWCQIQEQPDPPRALKAMAWAAGGLLTLLVAGTGGTRIVSQMFGWHPFGLGSWGPSDLAKVVFLLFLIAAATVVFGSRRHAWEDRGGDEVVDQLGIVVGTVLLSSLLWVAIDTGKELMGSWQVPLLIAAVLTGCCAISLQWTSRINKKRNNLLRAAFSAQPDLAQNR
ncbi:NACHT domain-containing protein [Streptomyces sp. S3(2020)]|uniref:NACHT domain-containing protein n=1 Tax=Streptomyces sp. S3(2020) TaxID=2732044 RepID=UPI001489D8E3|nr:NACHT domain-containing protein [Streptomyces sp. S3(2020)]